MRGTVRWAVLCFLFASAHAGCAIRTGEDSTPIHGPRPIPASPGETTRSDFDKALATFFERNFEQAYEERGSRSPDWDARAIDYLRAWKSRWIDTPEALSYEHLAEQGKALVDSGCDDPAILYLAACARYSLEDVEEAEPLLRRAVAEFEKRDYPRAAAALAAGLEAGSCEWLGGAKGRQAGRYSKLTVAWIVDSAADGSYREGEHRVMLEMIDRSVPGFSTRERESLYEGLTEAPGVHPYVRSVVGGWVHTDKAWDARGSGWADSVTEEGWRGFRENLATARKLLSEAWEKYPDCPEAPAAMITIAMAGQAGPGETERMWFDRSVAAQMDFTRAYDALIKALLPRWGGSHEEIFDFGVECLGTERFDTVVPFYFFYCVNRIATDIDGDPAIWAKPKVRDKLDEMFDGYHTATKGKEREGYRSYRAAVAWRAGDCEQARVILDSLGDRVDPAPFDEFFDVEFEEARREIYALGGEHADALREANARSETGQSEQALATYRKVLSQTKTGSPTACYVRDRMAVARLEINFPSGEWIPLKPDADLAGWTVLDGEWKVKEDGSLLGASHEGLWLECDADFGNCLELEGEVEFVSSPSESWPSLGVSLRCCSPPVRDEVALGVSRRDGRVFLSHKVLENEMEHARAQVGDLLSFRVRMVDEAVSVFLDGKPVIQDARIEMNHPGMRKTIKIGTYYRGDDVVLRFKDMKVRRLTSRGR